MIGNFIIAKGSTLPWLDVQITQDGFVEMNLEAPKPLGCSDDGDCGDKSNAVDLTDANVQFKLFKCGRTPVEVVTYGVVEVLDAECGKVRYKWHPNDLAGCDDGCLFYGQFVVTFMDNTQLLWPYAQEQLTIEVR